MIPFLICGATFVPEIITTAYIEEIHHTEIYIQYQIIIIIIYCPYATLVMKDQPPSLTDTNIHSDTQAVPRKLSSLTLYIDLWRGGNQYQINLSRLEEVTVDVLYPRGDSALTSLLSAADLFNGSKEHDIGSI
jgi:hypothetical protein